MRPSRTWIWFGACSAVALVALGWLSFSVLDLERAEREARRSAALEENVRLALWRLESRIAPLVTEENARPYFTYTAFYPAERTYTNMFARIERGEVLVPSPLLTVPSPYIGLHFQLGPGGELTSPQVPTGNQRDLAESGYTTHEAIEDSARKLAELRVDVDWEGLRARISKSEPVSLVDALRDADLPVRGGRRQAGEVPPDQQKRSAIEFQARGKSFERLEQAQMAQNTIAIQPPALAEASVVPVWLGERLLLARRVEVMGVEYLQGCSVEWPLLEAELRESVADLLPDARLEPVRAPELESPERRLVSLPVRLLSEDGASEAEPLASPIRWTLVLAWGAALVAAGSVAALLRGVIALSERRRVFVSAVTHELRTPLTTFRMYADMLAEGMVPDGEKRGRYLRQLQAEAERLGHLVENVLFYARAEGGRVGAARARVNLYDLLVRLEERLHEKLCRAGKRLEVIAPDGETPVEANVDASAVEQILVNLIDNACKYGGIAGNGAIAVRIEKAGGHVAVRLRDHGPGISPRDRKRLFHAFSKSDREAANSAPGVGLGLALSRRLARALGGDLRLDESVTQGAGFVLTLPAA